MLVDQDLVSNFMYIVCIEMYVDFNLSNLNQKSFKLIELRLYFKCEIEILRILIFSFIVMYFNKVWYFSACRHNC